MNAKTVPVRLPLDVTMDHEMPQLFRGVDNDAKPLAYLRLVYQRPTCIVDITVGSNKDEAITAAVNLLQEEIHWTAEQLTRLCARQRLYLSTGYNPALHEASP